MKHTRMHERRGNALVMVSAMLVLLTLIAAAYLSRTRAQRITASAIQETAGESRRAESISKQLASEVAMHLFVKPIDPTASGNIVGGDSAGNRLPPPPEAIRYGVESAPPRAGQGTAGDTQSNLMLPAIAGFGQEPGDPRRITRTPDGFPDGYNYPPYQVAPWTNWPDFTDPVSDPSKGTPWLIRATSPAMSGAVYGNPLGNPGFGDTRWLRSTEPVRAVDLGSPTARQFVPTPGGSFFSHWAHLSWIPTPSNGWRLVTDIADVEGSLRQGSMYDESDGFGTPYEQWWPDLAPNRIPVAATSPTSADSAWVSEFTRRRNLWLSRNGYRATVAERAHSATGLSKYRADALPNFIKLDDPLGIGRTNDPDAEPVPPGDEYIEGTPRNMVARTFADADGDGFTDSFWFLAPVGKERNVRTVVGVSVIDNAGMLDLNVATRFDRRTTIGFTPADLAVVTSQPELAVTAAPSLNFALTDTRTGLFDNEWNFSFGTLDPRDPAAGGNPAAFKTPLTSRTGFGMAFDPYRFAGRPTPQDPNASPIHDDGSPSMLQSLGVRMTDQRSTETDPDKRTFWAPYFYGAPGAGLRLQPWLASQFGPDGGPAIDVYGPGGPVRPQQAEPLVGIPSSGSSVDWQPWYRFLWGTLPRDNINGPMMRSVERTRWFQSALDGEMRVFAPFDFGAPGSTRRIEAQELLPTATVRDIGGRALRIRPFDASDEVELRAFAGNNDSTNMSRLEKALNSDDMVRDKDFEILDSVLRSSVLRAEGGPGGAQLTSAQLVKDMRRKVTALSGQRNELMPPWLWTGRPYLAPSMNPRETFQSAMLWLNLHPEAPGPRDENNDGRIDGQELQWGVYDLWRASTSGDPFPDGRSPSFSSANPSLDSRDWRRGVRIFETFNRKLDLRRPLLIDTFTTDEEGLPRYRYAYSVPEERRAMLEFARDARQRLRAALRTHSPQRNRLDWTAIDDAGDLGDPLNLPTVELLGPLKAGLQGGTADVAHASYTDRFIDQLRLGLDARVAEGANPEVTSAAGQSTVGLGSNLFAWRSAWSTEAMTASLAANLATWRARPTRMRELTANPAFAGRDLGLRPIWQPILPNLVPMPSRSPSGPMSAREFNGVDFDDMSGQPQMMRERSASAQAVRAVDPSSPAAALPNSDFPAAAFQDPGPDTANLVFPGVAKHPFLTECFFGWVYPATTTSIGGKIEPAIVKTKDFATDPANNGNKFVAVVNGRVGNPTIADGIIQPPTTAGRPEFASGVDTDRDELNEIRTPILVIQVANPWNEAIRLGDFRLEIFGQRYDFPDYETDSNGAVITDVDGRPVPLMLNPGTEAAPATATVYLIANVLGNPTGDPGGAGVLPQHQGDLPKVAQWDPWFRRRWLDYFDLYELLDKPDFTELATDAARLDPQPKATSPRSWPLYRVDFTDPTATDPIPASKLLNAMQPDGDPNKARITSLAVFKDRLFKEAPFPTTSEVASINPLKRGIVLQRVIRDPSAVAANRQLLTKNLGRWNATTRRWELRSTEETEGLALEVDRFDADPGLDHFSAKIKAVPPGGTVEMFKDPAANFDTNLVTGGRFWSACARITLPPAEDTSPFPGGGTRDLPKLLGSPPGEPPTGPRLSFDEPRGVRGCFPPSTATVLVRPASDPLTLYNPGPPVQGETTTAPAGFPGIMLGNAADTTGRDYFTTWTRVARHWSRLFDVRMGTVQGLGPATGATGAPLPILHPDPVPPGVQSNLPVWTWTRQAVDGSFTRFGDGDGSIPWNRTAPRFVFASRTEPDQMLNPRPPKRIELTGFRSSGDSAEAAAGESIEEVALGDVFRLDASSDPKDPDLWTPSFGSSTWMADTASFGWLTSPVWAPLPDFQRLAMGARAAGADVPFAEYPELVLRKPTAFNCQTVLDPRPERYDLTNGLAMAYYGDSRQAPDANPTAAVNTSYARAAWVAGADATLNAAYVRVYHGDKGARLLDHDGALLRLQVETGRPDAARQRWTMQGMWNTLARFPNVNSMQMLWKNDDFEQLGEILDVFAWGPAYRIGGAFGSMDTSGKLRAATVAADNPLLPDPNVPTRLYPQCRATFAEIMTGRVPGFPVGEGDDTNRLQVDPPNLAFAGADVWQFAGDPALSTPYGPGIPWGARVFDAFTLDGSGASLRYDWSDAQSGAIAVNAPWTATSGADVFETGSTSTGSGWWDTRQDRSSYSFRDQGGGTGTTRVDRPVGALFPVGSYLRPDGDTNPNNDVVTRTSLAQWEYDGSPTLSGGFRGRPVKGLLNLNTAPVEVLRTLPHMTQMVYDDTGRIKNSGGYTDGSPYAGAGVVGGDRRFNAGFAPPAGKARNPASLVPDAIDIYRNRLNPSWLIGNAGSATSIANGATAWVPNPADPLQPRDTLAPTLPTYSDRGEAAPAGLTGGAATPARLNALWSFVRPANGIAFSTSGNISGSNRIADVPVPFNRGMRAAMGFGSMGELTLMSRTIVGNSGGLSGFSAPPGYVAKLGAAANFPDWQYDQGWSIRLAGQDPYRSSWSAGSNGDGLGQGWFADFKDNPDEPLDARLATDRQGFRSFDFFDIPSTKMSIDDAWTLVPDGIAGDSEEQNLLFKGISNLVSTRSDVFTVYFRVRTIRQDALTGKWNGVDPDSILEDARYVMCVDRSNVNRPTDEPRIIYFSRVNE